MCVHTREANLLRTNGAKVIRPITSGNHVIFMQIGKFARGNQTICQLAWRSGQLQGPMAVIRRAKTDI